LESTFQKHSDRIALSFIDDYTLKYSDIKNKISSISSYLKDQGIIKGDRVAVLGENHPNWGLAYFAITSIGAVAVPVMYDFSPSEVAHILRHSGSKILFISTKYCNKIEDLKNNEIQQIVLLDDFSILPENFEKSSLRKFIEEGKKEFSKIKEAALKFVGLQNAEIKEDDLASLIYTSGTTGQSKGVMLSHKNIVSDTVSVIKMTGITPEDKMLSILPLSHAMECTLGLITPIMAGASGYYLNKLPTASSLLPALKKVRPTIMVSVPLIIEKIYKLKILPNFKKNFAVKALYHTPLIRKKMNLMAGKKLVQAFGGKLKMLCIGGAALAGDVEKFLHEAKFPYTVGYGLTETAPLVTGNIPSDFVFHSVGKPLGGVQIKIEKTSPDSENGEILVKGGNVMQGYYKMPEKTKEAFTEDGWFRTGDLGCINKKGYLFIKGRIKNMILGSNGKNIYPEELEAIINECSYVMESLVYDIGGRLAARIHLDYKSLDEAWFSKKFSESEIRKEIKKLLSNIVDEVNQRVPGFSRISSVYEQPEPFEKTPTLKIKRYVYV